MNLAFLVMHWWYRRDRSNDMKSWRRNIYGKFCKILKVHLPIKVGTDERKMEGMEETNRGTYSFLKCLKEKGTHIEKWKKMCISKAIARDWNKKVLAQNVLSLMANVQKNTREGGNQKQKERQISCRSIIKKIQWTGSEMC